MAEAEEALRRRNVHQQAKQGADKGDVVSCGRGERPGKAGDDHVDRYAYIIYVYLFLSHIMRL